MASFNILRIENPSAFRNQILCFWQEYLPGTPPERFEWMISGNPAGPAVWFLAFEQGSEKIAGTVTVMPRRMYLRGQEIRAGILGDFMVAAKYRVFGPNLQLLRTALGSLEDLNFSFIYSIPNDASSKVAERVGMREISTLRYLVRPLDMRFYLSKYLQAPLATALAPAAGLCLRISSFETFHTQRCTIDETSDPGEAAEHFWEHIRTTSSGLIGERSRSYLEWRYQRNPLYRFRFLLCRKPGSSEISAFAVFCVREGNKLEIYDIMASERRYRDALISHLITVGNTERHQAVYFLAPGGSRWIGELRRFRFIDTKDTLHLGCYGGVEMPIHSWDFVSGDRNI